LEGERRGQDKEEVEEDSASVSAQTTNGSMENAWQFAGALRKTRNIPSLCSPALSQIYNRRARKLNGVYAWWSGVDLEEADAIRYKISMYIVDFWNTFFMPCHLHFCRYIGILQRV
jgi:hypothetical protein